MSTQSSRLSTPTRSLPANHPAHQLLARAHSPDTANAIFTDKIAHKPLLLNPTSTSQPEGRALRRHIRLRKKAYAVAKQRPKPLSARERRELGVYDLQPRECRYEIYVGLNRLWKRYVLEVLGYLKDGEVVGDRVGMGVSVNGSGSLLASADFHGMEVEVVRCCDVRRVGLKGIVVRETRSALVLVLDEREDVRKKGKRSEMMGGGDGRDKIRMVLKRGAVFRVVLDLPRLEGDGEMEEGEHVSCDDRQLVYELHGHQLEMRPVERAVKKFKWKAMGYL